DLRSLAVERVLVRTPLRAQQAGGIVGREAERVPRWVWTIRPREAPHGRCSGAYCIRARAPDGAEAVRIEATPRDSGAAVCGGRQADLSPAGSAPPSPLGARPDGGAEQMPQRARGPRIPTRRDFYETALGAWDADGQGGG